MIAVQTIHVFFCSRVMEGLDVLSMFEKARGKAFRLKLWRSFAKLNSKMFALRFYLNMN